MDVTKAEDTISDLTDLISILGNKNLDQSSPCFYFRGESTYEWALIPKLLRCSALAGEHGMPGLIKDESNVLGIQMRILQRLKRYAVHLYLQSNRPWQGEHPSDWEWLCVAQHHGAPTLLLDWTINPLVALYLSAWKDHSKTDGAFYMMELQDKSLRDTENLTLRIGQHIVNDDECKLSLEKAHGPIIVVPLVFTRRIEAQAARFIYTGYAGQQVPDRSSIQKYLENVSEHKDSDPEIYANLAVDRLSTGNLPWKAIKKYLIPRKIKKHLLRQLRNGQIHHGTLFPDLDGYSIYLGTGGD